MPLNGFALRLVTTRNQIVFKLVARYVSPRVVVLEVRIGDANDANAETETGKDGEE